MPSRFVKFLWLLVGLPLVMGCDQQAPATSSSAASPSVVAEVPAVTLPPSSMPEEELESITVSFVEVMSNERGKFVVLKFTNATDRTITGIRGAVHVLDVDGNMVRGYGYTSQLFDKAPGESVELPLLKIAPDGPLAERFDNLSGLNYRYVAQEITYAEE